MNRGQVQKTLQWLLGIAALAFALSSWHVAHILQLERAQAAGMHAAQPRTSTLVQSAAVGVEAATGTGASPASVSAKDPGEMAVARVRLERLRRPDYRAGVLDRETQIVRAQWEEWAQELQLSPHDIVRLVAIESEARVRDQERWLECVADPACKVSPWDPGDIARRAETDALVDGILGPERRARLMFLRGTGGEHWQVDRLRERLPPEHALTDADARRLVVALAEERQRFADAAKRDGMDLDCNSGSMLEVCAASTPDESDVYAVLNASALEFNRRQHAVASRVLNGPQLSVFAAGQQDALETLQREMRRWEIARIAREAAGYTEPSVPPQGL